MNYEEGRWFRAGITRAMAAGVCHSQGGGIQTTGSHVFVLQECLNFSFVSEG